MSFGLVLGGGGTRGSYHIGAYKALTELSKVPTAIVGTSIGAINGAVITQGDFSKLLRLWENIAISDVLRLPEGFKKNDNLFDIKNAGEIVKEIYRNGGIDATPLKRLMDSVIDEEKFRASETDFALVTFSVSDKKEIVLKKSQIPDGKLTQFLLASAGFPGLKPVKIGDSVYVDGGVSNNIPINILTDRDIDDIAVIDVGGVGIVKDADISGKNIITVRSDDPAVGIMDFTEEALRRNMEFGYFDTLKAFGKCVGERYYIEVSSYFKNREFYGEVLLLGLEQAAVVLGVTPFKIYTIEELIARVRSEFSAVPQSDGMPEILKNLNEKSIVSSLARGIITKNTDFLSNKIVTGLLGNWYEAANAIAYFCKN